MRGPNLGRKRTGQKFDILLSACQPPQKQIRVESFSIPDAEPTIGSTAPALSAERHPEVPKESELGTAVEEVGLVVEFVNALRQRGNKVLNGLNLIRQLEVFSLFWPG